VRVRDARQPVMPQLKVGHLRAIPSPPNASPTIVDGLTRLGQQLSDCGGAAPDMRSRLDSFVFEAFDLSAVEFALVLNWHAKFEPRRVPTMSDDGQKDDGRLRMRGRPGKA
jgi:hypothetical protein